MIKILLVDHASENARSVHELFSEARPNNFKLDRVLSHREILKGFRSKVYDVCLIDSGFDNGLKLFAQARGVGCTAPIVLVTANNAAEVLQAMRNGVADCLVRDELDASRIERAICSVVEQARGAGLLTERERRYLALLDNANEIIYTHDLDGNFTSINRAGERLSGYSQQEILGLNVLQLVEPGYRTLVRKMIERTLDAQVHLVERIELLTKAGHNLTVAMGLHPIYREGKAIEIQALVTTLHEPPSARPRAARNLFGPEPERRSRPNPESHFISNPDLPGRVRLQVMTNQPVPPIN
jgi:two-component system response regulator